MKKKILTALLATALVASMLTACGSKTNDVDTPATETTETTHTGSDDIGSDVPSSGDAPENGGTSESPASNVDDAAVMASETAIKEFGADEIPAYNMQLTPEALSEYQEETSNRGLIANTLINNSMSGFKSVYNPANYGSTLDMITTAQSDSIGGNIFGSIDGRDEQIAKAMDALASNLGAKIVVMTTFSGDSSMVMFYCDNGIGYGVDSASDEGVIFHTGSSADEPYQYDISPDGTVKEWPQ